MATQQILFAETIAGMKKAFKRKAYADLGRVAESDSDSEIENYSNRGNKLKKGARFAHKGQLVPTNGPSSYQEYVDYAGVRRPIIHRNPPLIDDEGYEIDSDDDDDRLQDAEASAAELNPYANIHLESILAPLTSSTSLSTHPTLSKPFTSKTLTRLVDQSCDITRKENHSLWQVRHLLTALCGDYTWVPCEMMVRPSDIELYTEDHVARHLLMLSQTHAATFGETPSPATLEGDIRLDNGTGVGSAHIRPLGKGQNFDKPSTEDVDISMTDADAVDEDDSSANKAESNGGNTGPSSNAKTKAEDAESAHKANPVEGVEDGQRAGVDVVAMSKGFKDKATELVQHSEGGTTNGPRHIHELVERTDSQAPSPAPGTLDQTFVHPMFIAPAGAKPDRDVGLPEPEAEDIRRLLALYVQKQEEVARGAKKLYLGLLKAEKLRKDVLHWSKAEAHSGPNRDMSDGEDWYDKEEWGLTEELKKGQDEEEEDTQTTGKKTRNRK
ncbi:Fc.00g038950.m01.CDS01 [Cosmosporella sp. VM-42]